MVGGYPYSAQRYYFGMVTAASSILRSVAFDAIVLPAVLLRNGTAIVLLGGCGMTGCAASQVEGLR